MVSGKPKLSEGDRDYIAKQTSMTPSEVEIEYENFIRKHPDGKILKQDFSHELRSVVPYVNCLKLEKLVFEVFDKNHDGFIGKSTF